MENTTKKTPQVSIGMPVYNGDPFIREALDSLLAQTFTDFELIISDNASTDGTEAICREYAAKDVRIRYVRQERNRGPAANFQFVLDEAVGEYFLWTAADDCFSGKEDIMHLVNSLKDDIDYVFPEVNIINAQGEIIRKNVMRIFEKAKTKMDYAKASIQMNTYQIYGLFKIKNLREDFKFLDKCHKEKMMCFAEGLFVHVISTERRGFFVKESYKFYRRHEKNQSSVIPAKELLPDFIKYSLISLKYFMKSRISSKDKIWILFMKMRKDIEYILYLTLAIVAQKYPELKKIKKLIFKK